MCKRTGLRVLMMQHRVGGKQLLAHCPCARCSRSWRALSTRAPGNLEPNGVVRGADAAATLRRRQRSSQQHHPGGLGRVTDWGVPPRHSIAAYLLDSRDHEFPPRWLGASLPALASVRRQPLQPPPLPTAAVLTAVANLQAERAAAEAVVVDARRTLNDAWKSADSLHAQGVDQQDSGLLNAWWNKIKATSAVQWHVADAGDDLLEAKEALAEVDGKVWRQLHLTKLPPTHYEQVINAGIWECLSASQPPLALTERLFEAGPPPSLGSVERLAEIFDVDFLRRNELLISWDQLLAYTAGCEQEADRLASKLNVDSKSTDHVEAMSRSVLHSKSRRIFCHRAAFCKLYLCAHPGTSVHVLLALMVVPLGTSGASRHGR